MTPKLTDEQIVQAFKNCFMPNDTICEKCPAFDGKCNATNDFLISQILDLINRLKADNERLIDYLDAEATINGDLYYDNNEIKTEAYKEFVNKIHSIITEIYNKYVFNGFNDLNSEEIDAVINYSDDVTQEIDNFLKEMVGD